MTKRVYLDNAATTPMLGVVKNTMVKMMEEFGNASSLHFEGRRAQAVVEKARAQVAALIGAQPQEIIFTSGGTEANNLLVGTFWGQRYVTSAIEHPSIHEPVMYSSGKGKRAHFLPVDSGGIVDIDALRDALVFRPGVVSVMLANNEIGVVQNLNQIADLAHPAKARVHTDATQAVGKIPVNVDALGVDYLTLSAHKIGGPQGVGALYVREKSLLKPLLRGGSQELNRRAGTYNTAAIAGFGAAAVAALKTVDGFRDKVQPLTDKLKKGIVKNISNVVVNGDQKNCLPHILNVSFAGAEGESIMLALDEVGIAVSTGSACATGDIRPSRVLTAINADPELAHSSIRFSLGANTTAHDIDFVLTELPLIIERLRQMSTLKMRHSS
ncbi:MAG: cysteine desulfurase [Candidatus Nomurabacteria bacterium]|jgi:cysteine desulfurase|nr:cysteine desulfurase [Candidatus Nomurabacteria bacterium]